MDSSRVAPSGVYTHRSDIPRYRMCQHQPNMMYANVVDRMPNANLGGIAANVEAVSSDEENNPAGQ